MERSVARSIERVGVAGGAREQLLSDLFDAHYPALRSLALAILGDLSAAEDAASEVFVKAFSGWRRFRMIEHPPSYLRAMLVNECRGRIRRSRVEARVNELVFRRDESPSQRDPADSHADAELLATVRALPERQRACIVLRYLEDLPDREIAEILGCSLGTVKSQLFKARASLEKILTAEKGVAR